MKNILSKIRELLKKILSDDPVDYEDHVRKAEEYYKSKWWK